MLEAIGVGEDCGRRDVKVREKTAIVEKTDKDAALWDFPLMLEWTRHTDCATEPEMCGRGRERGWPG